MILFKHEMKQNSKTLMIWSLAVGLMCFVCILMFSEMKGMVGEMDEMFSSMGSFTKAFGMDQMSIGTIMGFYGIECANILGLGGAFLAALLSIAMLSKEESNRTAEFLLTNPISRVRVVTEKALSIVSQLVLFNIIVVLLSCIGFLILGEKVDWGNLFLFHLAELILQLQIVGICFGISAFIKRGSLGIGLGLATSFYFLNIIANISDKAEFLKYLTPYSYTEASDIFTNGTLEGKYLVIGILFGIIGYIVAYLKYTKKDIQA